MVSVMAAHEEEGEDDIETFPALIANLRRRALAQQEDNRRESGDDAVNPDLIDNAIRWAVYINAKRKLNTLYFVKNRFDELQLVSRVTSPEAEINILRQGFILLMTAFDAHIRLGQGSPPRQVLCAHRFTRPAGEGVSRTARLFRQFRGIPRSDHRGTTQNPGRVVGELHSLVVRGAEFSAPNSEPVASLEFKVAEDSLTINLIDS